MYLSHSELATWKNCKRRWWLTYGLGYAPDPARAVPVGPAHLGTAVHLALEAHYGHGIDPLQCLKWDYAETIETSLEFAEDLGKELETALAMVEGYLTWAAEEGIDAGLEIIGTEVAAQATITTAAGHEVELRGKFDQLVCREIDGTLLARDFKTVAVLQQVDQLRLSRQLRHYCLIQALNAQQSGERVEGGIFLMLRRVRRGASSKPPYYAQEAVHLNKHDLNSYWMEVREVADEIIRARARLAAGEDHRTVVYASPSDRCLWGCDFKSQCPLYDDGSRADDAVKSQFIKRDPYSYYSDSRIDAVVKALGH